MKKKSNIESIAKKVESLLDEDKYQEIINLIEKSLDYDEMDHWFLCQLGISYYELFQYEKSYNILKKAYENAPKCPITNKYYAGACSVTDRVTEAIEIYINLLDKDTEELAYEECGEGIKWAKSVKNDIRYFLAMIYKDKGDFELALKYIIEHKENRRRGQFSIYSKKLVEEKYKLITDEFQKLH